MANLDAIMDEVAEMAAKVDALGKRADAIEGNKDEKLLFVIFCDGDFDQICETKATAEKEKRDLVKMGFTVKIKEVKGWKAAEAYER